MTASNAATGLHRATTTNETGYHSLRDLPIGSYTINVEQQGFRTYLREGRF